MIKRLYLANGYLLAPINIVSDDVAVDTSTATLLQTKLGVGDHCYLTLLSDEKLEVIKIRRDYSGFRVDRSQDGTTRQNFPIGTQIVYRLTSVEITDASAFNPYNIYASGYGYATVLGGNETWSIEIDVVHADTVGGIETRTEGNKLVISDRIGMFGCCDGGVTGAPFIPGPFFYLTSKLYPYETVDIVSNNPKDKNGNLVPPMGFDNPWWLLTQPSVVEGVYVNQFMVPFEWQVYGGSEAISVTEPTYVSQNIGTMDWNLYGGAEAFSSVESTYITMNAYVLEMLLFGSAVTYDRAIDAYVLQNIQVLDWVLIDG